MLGSRQNCASRDRSGRFAWSHEAIPTWERRDAAQFEFSAITSSMRRGLSGIASAVSVATSPRPSGYADRIPLTRTKPLRLASERRRRCEVDRAWAQGQRLLARRMRRVRAPLRETSVVTLVHHTDTDFRLCRLPFEDLVGLQRRAEALQWGTRWTSEEALRGHLRDEEVLLMTFMREEWADQVRAIRCVVLASLAGDSAGCLVTVDVEPEALPGLGEVVRDAAVCSALSRVFRLGLSGGIQVASKP